MADIVAVGLEAADAGGLAAVSLPRLADRMGLTTTALYRYVASKDELMVLLADAATGDPPTLNPAHGWRACARTWTRAVIAMYRARPWLLDVPLRAPITPQSLRWLETFLQATAVLPLHVTERARCATLLNAHARGVATLARDLSAQVPAYPPAVVGALLPVLAERGYPQVAGLLTVMAEHPEAADDDLTAEGDFGTDRILDGIATLVAARQERDRAHR